MAPRKEIPDVNVMVAARSCIRLTYVAHLGRVGTGVKRLKFGKDGGFPCLLHHGS